MPHPIIFIPGLMTTGRIYQHQIEALGQEHTVLLANHWSASSMAEIAKQILAIAPDDFAVVGTSMGGYVALEIERQAPSRVAKIALLSTSARPDTPDRSAGRRQQVAAAKETGMRESTRALWPKLVHPARHEDLAMQAMFFDMAETLGVDAFERQIEAIIGRADSRPHLAAIEVPTLVIAGEDDTLITPDNSEELAAGIPGAQLEKVAYCGHMGMVERPETYTRLLADFLRD